MYRTLAIQGLSRDRRRQRVHPVYAKPNLLARRANEVWFWDISKLKGPVKWTCFHLYVILDIFSRYVVSWRVAARESAQLAEQIIADAAHKQCIAPGTLSLHADTCRSRQPHALHARRRAIGGFGSPRHTVDRMSRMTIRTRKAKSKP